MKQQPTSARTPKRARPKREGIEQELPEEQAGLSREQSRDEATVAEPQRRGTAETGEDEDLPNTADMERGAGARRGGEP